MKPSDEIGKIILLRNDASVDDFLGLTPNEVDHLLYRTFGDGSPVRLRQEIDDTILDRIPLFRIAEEYLKIIQRDKQIKLTPLGALPKKVLVEIYDKRILPEEHIDSGIIKLSREQDCVSISSARWTVEFAGLTRKAAGKLFLTKKAIKLLETNHRAEVFRLFFQAFTGKFMWSANDGYSEEPIGQLGWAFSVYMLAKFGGDAATIGFYADKYLKAFPGFLSFFTRGYASAERQFGSCYGVRTFDRFFLWFGFVTVDDQKKEYSGEDHRKFERTDVVNGVFTIKA